jgi:hypothetical protein
VNRGDHAVPAKVLLCGLLAPPLLLLLCCDQIQHDSTVQGTKATSPKPSETPTPPSVLGPNAFPDQEISALGNAKASLSIEWREGQLLYQFSISTSAILRAAISRSSVFAPRYITLSLSDGSGFQLVNLPLKLHELVGSVPETGGPAWLFSAKGAIPCTRERYLDITNWEISWTL